MAFCTMSRLALRSGAMFTAASVMNSVCGCVGTSMTNTWLMRRPVRRPVSRLVTAARISSECRLPFIKSWARPERTISTAISAAAWLCGASTISVPCRSMSSDLARLTILSRGPTRIGVIIPASAASKAPRKELSSQGWATAVTDGSRPFVAATRRSYFSCSLSWVTAAFLLICWPPPGRVLGWRFASPFQVEAHLARHAAGEADDFGVQLVAEMTQLLGVEIVGFLGKTLERTRPLRVGNVDAPATIAAEGAGEGDDFHLVVPALGGDAHRLVNANDGFVVNFPRHEAFAQLRLLLFFLLLRAPFFVHLRHLGVGGDLFEVVGK